MATKKTTAAKPVDRKTQMLDAGAKLAAKYGHKNVTRRMVAAAVKTSEGLVSKYMGDATKAQNAYKRHAAKLGLALPTAAEAEAKGAKLRAHGPRKQPVVRRKRSDKEIAAIQRKEGVAKKTASAAKASTTTAKRTASASRSKPKPVYATQAPVADRVEGIDAPRAVFATKAPPALEGIALPPAAPIALP